MLSRRVAGAIALLVALAGCSRQQWPDPPAVDASAYDAEYKAWLDERQSALSYVLPIVGIWPLPEGDTAFGSDASLPIALPNGDIPPRAGLFQRRADAVTVIPAPGVSLRREDGAPINAPSEVTGPIVIGSLRLQIAEIGDERRWIDAWDEAHPAVDNPPKVDVYPPDPRWRVAARFDAYDKPRQIRIGDVRGGSMMFTSPGQLVSRLDGVEERLTVFAIPGEADRLFVMFKDATNGSTTFDGYRILTPKTVANGAWTVLDFNVASNPPCAYSRFTTCPLPPRENTLQAAIEAGEKRLSAGQGS